MSEITVGRVEFGKALAKTFADGVIVRTDEMERRIAVAVAAERERCAKVAEDKVVFLQKRGVTLFDEHVIDACRGIAAKIREGK
jgi:hypothetical protein